MFLYAHPFFWQNILTYIIEIHHMQSMLLTTDHNGFRNIQEWPCVRKSFQVLSSTQQLNSLCLQKHSSPWIKLYQEIKKNKKETVASKYYSSVLEQKKKQNHSATKEDCYMMLDCRAAAAYLGTRTHTHSVQWPSGRGNVKPGFNTNFTRLWVLSCCSKLFLQRELL